MDSNIEKMKKNRKLPIYFLKLQEHKLEKSRISLKVHFNSKYNGFEIIQKFYKKISRIN